MLSLAQRRPHTPRLVLMDSALTGFAVYEGRKRLGEYVGPAGVADEIDIEAMRVGEYIGPAELADDPTTGKEQA